jgi:hypothetical protein
VRAVVGDVRDPVELPVVTRRAAVLVVLALIVALGACSGDDDGDASGAKTATPSTARPTTSVASVVDGGVAGNDTCGNLPGFAEVAGEWANSQLSSPIEFTVERPLRADASPAWMRALLVPDDRAKYDSVWVVGHCAGKRWQVVDGGTSGVGCTAPVPAAVSRQLGVDCR